MYTLLVHFATYIFVVFVVFSCSLNFPALARFVTGFAFSCLVSGVGLLVVKRHGS